MSVHSAILACALVIVAAQNQPTFRALTRLVEVSVVAHDRSGRPVTDLTKGDFELLEDGQPQSIEIFSMQDERSPEPARASLPPPARETALTGDVRPADVSNWRDGQGTSVTVILIDRINSRDREPAEPRFLRRAPRAGGARGRIADALDRSAERVASTARRAARRHHRTDRLTQNPAQVAWHFL